MSRDNWTKFEPIPAGFKAIMLDYLFKLISVIKRLEKFPPGHV
jgi:hypothetical protein